MVALPQVWEWLQEVSDPEIPAISVVDLGIVRDVRWHGPELEVTITPTYSGCPAIQVIAGDIASHLRAHGVQPVRLTTRLAPAWSTDWITERGREALRQSQITPPAPPGLTAIAPQVACPHCGSGDTECVSTFGSTPCKALYRCRACREPFDYFKPLA
ncbi:MAG TPA: 1,2-phenylacetyl-CoA epoxidase subunit PaaD [Terriglobales bacterium]|jgi:ring-1,2-phenylacetyl-CoA epoxidase subunit PaaD